MVSNLRMQFANLADALTEQGKQDKAVTVLNKCFEVMPEKVVRYDEQILYLAEEYVEAGEKEKGKLQLQKICLLIDGYLLNFFHESVVYFSFHLPIHGRNLTDNRLLTRMIDRRVHRRVAFC